MAREPVESHPMLQLRGSDRTERPDWVVVEEPLEIRLDGEPVAVVMRTPGHDAELAAGFALTEGIVHSADELGTIRHCATSGDSGENVIDVRLAPGVVFDRERLRRNLMASAACGLCGRASIEALATQARPVPAGPRVRRSVLEALPGRLKEAQIGFGRSGALHAAALFETDGSPLICREDVGRHNALDKAIGHSMLHGVALPGSVLLVSGRTSFEILQKSAVAGIPIVCAISGPTSLAIETARSFNITLINFLRGHDMNIATGPERLVDA
jgi:FdhD protein